MTTAVGFTSMDVQGFINWYGNNKPNRFITEIHLHHVWKPDKHTYSLAKDKEGVIKKAYNFDTEMRGLDGFGHHILITPDGLIWLCRDLNEAPTSIKGRNGNNKLGPISVAILGNFDNDKESLIGEQRNALLTALRLFFDTHNLSDEKFIFHNEHSPRTSPGSSLNKLELLSEVRSTRSSLIDNIPYRDCDKHKNIDSIRYCVENNIMQLDSNGSFHPNSVLTRGELASILAGMVRGSVISLDSLPLSIECSE